MYVMQVIIYLYDSYFEYIKPTNTACSASIASALAADLLIHYGHSCLVPINSTSIPCLYVFVDIKINTHHLLQTLTLNFPTDTTLFLAGTIQFASAIRAMKLELEKTGFRVSIPQSKLLSVGEVLGCTAPRIAKIDSEDKVIVFITNRRFHLEAIMIVNPEIKAFRYDPYLGKLCGETSESSTRLISSEVYSYPPLVALILCC
jgi:2-(3-amino-3-carboxypropyl)histidine synthase